MIVKITLKNSLEFYKGGEKRDFGDVQREAADQTDRKKS